MENDITIYICDDDINFCTLIKQKINNMSLPHTRFAVSVFTEAPMMIEKIKTNNVNIVIVDIDMPVMSGFQAAKIIQQINKNVLLVFITSHDEKIFQSYSYKPVGLIRKDQLDNFEEYIAEVIYKIESDSELNTITFKSGSKKLFINALSVLYVESYKNNIEIHMLDGSVKSFRYTISSAETILEKHDIISAQKGLLINLNYVEKLTQAQVILNGGFTFNICRQKSKLIQKQYQDYIRRTV